MSRRVSAGARPRVVVPRDPSCGPPKCRSFRPRRLCRRTEARAQAPGRDQPALVGQDDGLHAVAQPELGQQARDVGLDRALGDEQLGGQLGVALAARRAVAAPRARAGSATPAARRAPGSPRAWANCSMIRRVTDGASSASPSATTRTACSSSSGGAFLSRKPLAPACSASKTYSSRSNVVRITTRLCELGVGGDAPGRLEPVAAGHLDVHQHDVGPQAPGRRRRLLAVRRLARPPRCRARTRGSCETPSRTIAWSSASRTRMLTARRPASGA